MVNRPRGGSSPDECKSGSKFRSGNKCRGRSYVDPSSTSRQCRARRFSARPHPSQPGASSPEVLPERDPGEGPRAVSILDFGAGGGMGPGSDRKQVPDRPRADTLLHEAYVVSTYSPRQAPKSPPD